MMSKEDMPQQKGMFKEDLDSKDWLGIVVNSEDPLFMGRCKVKVFEKFDEIPDADLPWAFPVKSGVFAGNDGFGSFSYPKKGTLVRVNFQDGDFYSPEYTVVENIGKKMHAAIKESYENCQVLVWDEDEDLKIIYRKKDGIFIWLKGGYYQIDETGKNINEQCATKHTTTTTTVEEVASSKVIMTTPKVLMGGGGASDPVVKWNELKTVISQVLSAMQVGPTTPAAVAGKAVWESMCSQAKSSIAFVDN